MIDEYYTDDGCNYRVIRYGEVGSDKVIVFDEINKIVYIKTGKFTTLANKKENVHFVDTISTQERTSFSANWYKTFNTELHSDTIGSNKPYYVLSKTNGEYWIDKETGLVIRDIERQVDYDYYLEEGNRALKSINDRITIYEYKFDTVTDEDLEVPDYTGYMVEERTE